MHQLCSAVAYLHRKGILHRNLKPKHLLVQPGPVPGDPLGKHNQLSLVNFYWYRACVWYGVVRGVSFSEGAQIILTDFALVRTLNTPPKPLTGEVITLWYRPPEILMGQRDYTAAVITITEPYQLYSRLFTVLCPLARLMCGHWDASSRNCCKAKLSLKGYVRSTNSFRYSRPWALPATRSGRISLRCPTINPSSFPSGNMWVLLNPRLGCTGHCVLCSTEASPGDGIICFWHWVWPFVSLSGVRSISANERREIIAATLLHSDRYRGRLVSGRHTRYVNKYGEWWVSVCV